MVPLLLLAAFVACKGEKPGDKMTTEAKSPGQKTGQQTDESLKVGGPCTYASHEGIARIVRVAQTPASRQQAQVIGGAGYEGYEVSFRFIPKPEEAPRIRKMPLLERDQLLTLNNSWYAGPRFLEKYHIAVGKEFPCILKLIQSGACTPVVFNLPTINTGDYFESRP